MISVMAVSYVSFFLLTYTLFCVSSVLLPQPSRLRQCHAPRPGFLLCSGLTLSNCLLGTCWVFIVTSGRFIVKIIIIRNFKNIFNSLFICTCICGHMSGEDRGRSDPLGLKLQAAVSSQMWVLGI